MRAGPDRRPHAHSTAAPQRARRHHRAAARPAGAAARDGHPATPGERARRLRSRSADRHGVRGVRVPRAHRVWAARRGRHLAARHGRAGVRIAGAEGLSPSRDRDRREYHAQPVRRARRLGEREQPTLPPARRPSAGVVTRPLLVAVTAPRRLVDGRERVTLNTAYVRALDRAGLVPLAVPTLLPPDRAVAALDGVRGLVLTGGEDVEPARYGAAPHPKLEATDPGRDAAEVALIAAAGTRGVPILAICRGIQILNVALGGTLYQDLGSERPGPIAHAGDASRHGVRVAPGSLLERTLGARAATVNSRHHQAIRDLAPGLKAVAWADDGVIEGAEPASPNEGWIVAVQWHPEDLTERALFEGFAQAIA